MTWDTDKLENILLNLNKQMKSTTSKKELATLMFDYFSVVEILKNLEYETYPSVINKHDSKNIKFSDMKEYYEEFYQDSYECLKENQEDLLSMGSYIDTTSIPAPRMSFVKRILEEDYLDMVGDFFSKYDKGHYKIFKNLTKGNIHFAKNEKEVGDQAKGKCYHFLSTDDTYIITNYNNKNNITVLPHEIAHAFELAQLKNIIHRSSWHFSSFTESYPKFIELLFLDFLGKEHMNYFLKLKYQFFDSLKLSSEYALSFISNLDSDESIGFSKDKRKLRLTKKYMDYVVSDLFSIYLYNLYKNDKDKFDMVIKKFHNYKGKSDELIWSLINPDILMDSYKKELDVYRDELFLSRTRN